MEIQHQGILGRTILCVFVLSTYVVEAQIKIIEASIYKHFPERGFTTAGLSSELTTLKNQQVERVPLAASDLKILEAILSTSDVKKHRQKKTGSGPYFGTIHTESKTIDVAIFQSVIIDLTNYNEYRIRDAKDQARLKELLALHEH